jgi:biotin transport system substrate-specific component
LSVLRLLAACVTGGILVVYGIGIPWLSVVANLPLPKATAGSIVFIPGDLIKAVLATTVAMTVKRTYPVIRA